MPDPVGDLRAIAGALPSASAVIGPHDEILAYNSTALAEGVVRGDRIGWPQVLDTVRRARRDGEPVTTDVEQTRSGRAARV
ncbi:MAG: hypothetical protein ACK5KK_15605, partial [Microbacterium sp.]